VRVALAGAALVGDEDGWEALRLENGVPRFGKDFDAKTYPQEASLEQRAVSFTKGCYLGQEVVCMLEMRGHVKRKLAPLVLETNAVPDRGAKVTTDQGEEVGEVTSAAFSPSRARAVALAMVKRASAEAGTVLRVSGAVARVR
jgi:folate-binding protein YgfZ